MESPFGSTLLVIGPESLLAGRAVTELIAAGLAQRPEAAVNRIPAGELTVGGLTEATGGSLFADASVVVVEELPELPTDVADALVLLATDPGPDLALVLVHPGGVKGKALLDRLRKAGVRSADFPSLKAWELPQFVIAEARRAGGRMEKPTAEVLVNAVGTDLNALASAVRQLIDDGEDQLLTEAAVRRYFGGRAEVRSYEIATDALAGQTGSALEKLRWALATGVGPPQVTAALAANLRELGKYLDARDDGLRDAQIAQRIGVPPWKLKSLGPLSRQWQAAGVARAIGAVARADAQVKGASSDAGFALEQMVLTIIGCRGRN
ncbi:MAG: DNA polymerase III subunit delta [Actinobacteria bacterium]|nr:DNA polymerase III subunit delta [Actinomycetota bacterium]